MSELLFHQAINLTNDEAGGHGSRWAVFDDDVSAYIAKHLQSAIAEAESVGLGIGDEAAARNLLAQGEPDGRLLLYSEAAGSGSMAGLMSLVYMNAPSEDGGSGNVLASFYPFFGDGVEAEAEVTAIRLFPNRLEARLDVELVTGGLLHPFDPLFAKSRASYRAEQLYRLSLSGLGYSISPTHLAEAVIDDPDKIRRFRASQAWTEKYGGWTAEDEAASLAAWKPTGPEDMEPIRISMGQMAALLPLGSGEVDDYQYHGEVIRVTERAVRLTGVDFWRVDTLVMRADEDFVLPIYVAERLFAGEWRPKVGEYVTGTLWLQAYATESIRRQ